MALAFLKKDRFLCLWTEGWFPVSECWCSTGELKAEMVLL